MPKLELLVLLMLVLLLMLLLLAFVLWLRIVVRTTGVGLARRHTTAGAAAATIFAVGTPLKHA